MAAAVLIPGLFLLHVLDANAALAAVLISLLVLIIPLTWSRNEPHCDDRRSSYPARSPRSLHPHEDPGLLLERPGLRVGQAVDSRDQGLP